jgi:hypothetical protein
MKSCEACEGENLQQREFAWLIEADGSYWDGHFTDSRGFTRKVDDAVRFARFQDAEAVKHWLLQVHSFALRTTRHCWVNGAVDASRKGQQ